MQGILQQTIIQMLFNNEAETYGIDMVCLTLKLNILKILNKGYWSILRNTKWNFYMYCRVEK